MPSATEQYFHWDGSVEERLKTAEAEAGENSEGKMVLLGAIRWLVGKGKPFTLNELRGAYGYADRHMALYLHAEYDSPTPEDMAAFVAAMGFTPTRGQ